MRAYINDNQIVKTVADDFIATEYADPTWTFQDVAFENGASVVLENGVVVLYKDSQAIQTRYTELEAKTEKTKYEEQELEYVNTTLNS